MAYAVPLLGIRRPAVGNICIDTCMIDISSLHKVAEGDEVIIFGESPCGRSVVEALETISYEVLTSISSRIKIKRIYVSE